MKPQQESTPIVFGEINISESTGSYVAKGGQGESTSLLQIKMYPTEPDNISPVELPVQSMSTETLLAAFQGKITVSS